MNHQELSSLLKEWPPAAAPSNLEERVFGPRPLPVPWWGRIPAAPLAVSGIFAGALLIWVMSSLVPGETPVTAPAPAPQAAPVAPPPPPPAPPKPKRAKPATVTSVPIIAPAVKVFGVMPTVPRDPANPTVEVGTVRLRLTVDKEGRVVEVEVLEGDSQLAAIAAEAVREWRYRPRLVNGEPTESVTDTSVFFGAPRPAAKARR
jgi:TonB family protein